MGNIYFLTSAQYISLIKFQLVRYETPTRQSLRLLIILDKSPTPTPDDLFYLNDNPDDYPVVYWGEGLLTK